MAEEEQPKKKKTLLIIVLVVIVLLIICGVVAFFVLKKDAKDTEDTTALEQKKKEETVVQVTVPPFLVNLADPLGRRFIKLSINIEVANQEIAEIVEKNMFQIRDKVILLLSSKTYSDLAALDSKLYLKNEIVERINQIIAPNTVNQIYFTDMIIQ